MSDYRQTMKPREDRICDAATREHADAQALVTYLIGLDGTVEATQESIAGQLGFWRELGRGIRTIEMSRFHRARNHVRDRIDSEGHPCCAYTLHYRRSGSTSTLSLVDPTGELFDHARAAIGTIRGWVSRERQHHTENTRMVETCELLADHCLARDDRKGYRLLQRVEIEIERDGTVTPNTMAELDTWLEQIYT
jgi:hypothetical protein